MSAPFLPPLPLPNGKPSFRPAGFSLVELLVVIVVIGVLAALLFPVASRLRSHGNQARCATHLRQIITAYLIRIGDNRGLFPPSRTAKEYDPATGATKGFKNAFAHLMLSDYIPNPQSTLSQPGAVPGDAGVYWCPGRDIRKTSPPVPEEQGAVYSYAHNTELGGPNAQPTLSWLGPNGGSDPNEAYNPGLARLAAVPHPSKIIAFTEQAHPGSASAGHLLESSWPFMRNATPTPPASGRQLDFTRHAERVNAAFLDGSVRSMTFDSVRGTRAEFLIPSLE